MINHAMNTNDILKLNHPPKTQSYYIHSGLPSIHSLSYLTLAVIRLCGWITVFDVE